MRTLATTAAFFALCSWAACAQSNNSGAKKQELRNATKTLQQMTSSSKVPTRLVNQAKCIAVIPNEVEGGFIAGGKHGTGVMSCRNNGRWSAPAFISITGGSLGIQAGGSNSQILLLMNKQGEQKIMNGNFQLTGHAVATGPTGSNRSGSVGWKAPVLAYQNSHGVYGGASISGSKMHIDHSAMHNVYGSNTSVHQVLSGSVRVPQQAQQFVSALPQANRMG